MYTYEVSNTVPGKKAQKIIKRKGKKDRILAWL